MVFYLNPIGKYSSNVTTSTIGTPESLTTASFFGTVSNIYPFTNSKVNLEGYSARFLPNSVTKLLVKYMFNFSGLPILWSTK